MAVTVSGGYLYKRKIRFVIWKTPIIRVDVLCIVENQYQVLVAIEWAGKSRWIPFMHHVGVWSIAHVKERSDNEVVL